MSAVLKHYPLEELENFPLAREYGWTSPIQDRCARREGLGGRFVRTQITGYDPRPNAATITIPKDPVIITRMLAPGPVVVSAPTVNPLPNPRLTEPTPRARTGRRTAREVDAVVKDYLALLEMPYCHCDLKQLAYKHGYNNGHDLMMTLRNRKVWRRRKPGGKS